MYQTVGARLLNPILAAGIAVPVQGFQLWTFFETEGVRRGADLEPLLVANAVLVGLLCTAAFDFSHAPRAGRALLIGCGVAMLIPGATVLDQVVAFSGPYWDAATCLAMAMPYLILLAALGAAEAGLYLLATRPRVSG